MSEIVVPHSDAAFWYWTVLATMFAGYCGFSLAVWWYTRSAMSALSASLAFWLFVITSSLGTMQSSQSLIPMRHLIMVQRAAWVPVVVTYWLIINAGLRRSNGRLSGLRRFWRVWQWFDRGYQP